MNGKKLLLGALSATLVLGVAAEAFAARPHAGRGMSPEVVYVRMMKQFDVNKDGRITADEAKAGGDRLFAAIDTDKDGSVTPGEFRAYRKEQREQRRAEREQMKAAGNETAANDEQAKPGDKDRDGKPHRGWKHDGKHGMGHGGGAMLLRIADKDENGQLSREEATNAADRLFKRMDRNNDGVISIDDMPNR